ncbi:hypothetical protein C0584_01735 [Candidatus Parcubacteria bacterium]|nr:MAG: hypothetical protein C0584_01735 [Candidatus Parcubacteria bacterium]
MIKKILFKIYLIVRESFLRKHLLRFLIFVNNYSYGWIKLFVIENGKHPKHEILRYDKFFAKHLNKESTVLDLGCGNGSLAKKISGEVKRVVAIDISERNIEEAEKINSRDNITYIKGDATSFDFKDKFDSIVLSNVLEHIEDRIEFLKKLHQLSDIILIRVPMLDRDWLSVYKKENGYEYRLDNTHFVEYTTKLLKEELRVSSWRLKEYSIQFGEFWGVLINFDKQ